MLLRFTQAYDAGLTFYAAGETAQIPDAQALALIKGQIARAVKSGESLTPPDMVTEPQERRAVKFVKAASVLGTLYSPPETAGFPVAVAERLVQRGFAVPFKPIAPLSEKRA